MGPCVHIKAFKAENGLEIYRMIIAYFVTRSKIKEPAHHKMMTRCFDSDYCNNHRLLACLSCIYFGCYEKHASYHAKNRSHFLYVELSNGNIMCLTCGDYVYDSDSEEIAEMEQNNCLEWSEPYGSWKPSKDEVKILTDHSNSLIVIPNPRSGIKGIINMGNTCFMSCIMQAFFHTPMLRDYIFSDQHKCYAERVSDCLVCQFYKLFQKYYAEDGCAVSLHEVIYFIWRHVPSLRSLGQHDAHEFFQASIDCLNKNTSAPGSVSPSSEGIIDVIFNGQAQLDFNCLSCRNASTKIDPFWNISLCIPEPPASVDLSGCLQHFTRPEKLSQSNCSACGQGILTQQVTFRVLPLVIVIQLKRFEIVNDKLKKKTVKVPFPIDLDMTPYVSGCKSRSEKEDMDNRYTLYAVVVHKSSMVESGHYLSFIRRNKNTWFLCNDDNVKPATESEVMACAGYLLFYHKTVLFYK